MTRRKYLAEAERELEDQFRYYSAPDPEVARNFINAVNEGIAQIMEFPRIGPPLARGYRKRVLRKPFRYKLVYRAEGETLLIAAVWADRRNPAVLYQRLEELETPSTD